MILGRTALSVEYSLRERPEPIAPKESQPPADLHGLSKLVYTVLETASLLGRNRRSVYEQVRCGLRCVRLGRKVLIPRSKIIAILSSEVQLDEQQHLPVPTRAAAARRNGYRPKKSTLPEVAPTVQQPRPKKEIKEKDPVSISEAAKILHVLTGRLTRTTRPAEDHYYTEYYGKRWIPRKALENFVNGLPAIALLEENIARYRADDQMDDEMEEVAARLLADWKCQSEAAPDIREEQALLNLERGLHRVSRSPARRVGDQDSIHAKGHAVAGALGGHGPRRATLQAIRAGRRPHRRNACSLKKVLKG